MVVLGVTFFVSLYGSMANLRQSVDESYRDLHFSDLTVSFASAPESVAQDIETVSGVDRVAGRVNVEAPAAFPGRSGDVIAARIISLPVPERPAVNDLLITDGRYVSQGSSDEVLAEQNFANHHGLRVGDAVSLDTPAGSWDGRIVGIAVSPEYLWPARSVPEHMPDVLRRWGVLFMAYDTAAPAFGFNATINEVAVTLQPGADLDAVTSRLQSVLQPYGISSLVPRAEQPSQVILDTMIGALDKLSLIFPVFFLVIVALTTYVLLTRMVHTQRAQIGVLLALGFARRRVLNHYLGFAILVGLAGSLAGVLAGYLLSFPVTDLFATQVSLPLVKKVPHWNVMVVGVALSLAFAGTAGILPAYRASRERPAETMRGDSPRGGGRRRESQARPLRGRVLGRLPYRQIGRNPVRSAFTVLALALAASLIIVPFGFLDAMDDAVRVQRETLNFDLRAVLYRPVPQNASADVASWASVAAAEPFITTTAVLDRTGETRNLLLQGIRTDSDSYRLFSRTGERVWATDSGVLLSAIFEKRGFRVGESLTVGGREMVVAGFVRDFSDSGFLPLGTVQAMLGAPGLVNGIFVRLDAPSSEDAVKDRLYASLPVWTVASTEKGLQDTTDMLRLYYGFIGIIVAFGTALAAAIVFNAVTINVLERNREIATMRTIGIKGGTIARVITVENLAILALSFAIGSVLGVVLTGYFVTLFGGDIFVLDANVYPQTFVLTGLLLLAVVVVSEAPSLRHVQRMNLAKVTKERAG